MPDNFFTGMARFSGPCRFPGTMRAMPQTKVILVDDGALQQVARVFQQCFPGRTPFVIADKNTWAAAGRAVAESLASESFIFPGEPELAAEMGNVDRVSAALAGRDVTPVAVGSGTINDLVKLAAGRAGLAYMVVGTAASMDGYTAFGASITEKGSKQTFDCPAPRAFVADLDVIANAPRAMAATGYADLLAKVTAGADWILADALGIEPINPEAWAIVQTPLRGWLADPAGVARHDKPALRNLMDGLVASGLAMQVTQNSRPASGAEHQFSHLWDMQGHTYRGHHVPHGAKVGIGTIAVAEIYEGLLAQPLEELDIGRCTKDWPTLEVVEAWLMGALRPPIRGKAIVETSAKHLTPDRHRERLERLKSVWSELAQKLRQQLIPAPDLRRMLSEVGAPSNHDQIGISLEQLRQSVPLARAIRRRYTVLDLASELRLLEGLKFALS